MKTTHDNITLLEKALNGIAYDELIIDEQLVKRLYHSIINPMFPKCNVVSNKQKKS